MAMRACWNLKRYTWFWITFAVIFVVQSFIVFVSSLPTERFPGVIIVPIGLADFACVYGTLKLVERVCGHDS